MAYGAEPVRGDCLTHTIYIWPSRELVAGSSYWPESWHEAFEQATSQLGCVVASYVLGGLPVTQQPITMELPVGSIRFSVRCRDTSIDIAVSEFEGPEDPGPDAPGPNGGTRRQPSPADGLILGLRGTGKSFTVVTFYGPLPPIPAGYRLASGTTDQAFRFEGIETKKDGGIIGSNWKVLTDLATFHFERPNAAVPAALKTYVLEPRPIGRVATARTSEIVLSPRLTFAGRTPSHNGTREEMGHANSAGDHSKSYWIDGSDKENDSLSEATDPINWTSQRKKDCFHSQICQ
jgi:hypothetical protein